MAALTEEQSMLKDQASSWAKEQAPVTRFRGMRDSGVETAFEPATWEAMVEMGWTGIVGSPTSAGSSRSASAVDAANGVRGSPR